MNEEIEIEFKCLVTKEEFDRLTAAFDPQPFVSQKNHYFDTPDFSLKNAGCALRIREKSGKAEMTLKQPAETGLLESTVSLTGEEVRLALAGDVPGNKVIERAAKAAGRKDFAYFGTLETTRAEMSYEGGLLVFDHSRYVGTEDFEIEFEAQDVSGEAVFRKLLADYEIEYKPSENKIRRFYNALKTSGGN